MIHDDEIFPGESVTVANPISRVIAWRKTKPFTENPFQVLWRYMRSRKHFVSRLIAFVLLCLMAPALLFGVMLRPLITFYRARSRRTWAKFESHLEHQWEIGNKKEVCDRVYEAWRIMDGAFPFGARISGFGPLSGPGYSLLLGEMAFQTAISFEDWNRACKVAGFFARSGAEIWVRRMSLVRERMSKASLQPSQTRHQSPP